MKRYLIPVLLTIFFACKQKPDNKIVSKAKDFEKGESWMYKNHDSAFYYFNRVTTSNNDSLDIALSYNYMAIIQSDAGDYFGAQESLMRALKLLRPEKKADRTCLASIYNELGATSNDLSNYKVAPDYFKKALQFAEGDFMKSVILNNMAISYQRLKQYDEAIKIYKQSLTKTNGNKREYARILSNIVKTKWLQNPHYQAGPKLLEALNIRKKEQDEWGLNASYAHLSDYYAKDNPDLASKYALSMYQTAQKLVSPDDQLEALQKLIRLSTPLAAKKYFEIYQHLADSVQTARNASKNQFALIRYETEKSKADNLKLQQENSKKEYQIVQREILLMFAVILFIALIVIGLLWYKKRKQKLDLEMQTAIRDSQLKTSKKVHDVVANGLYRIMSEMENQPNVDKEAILDRIEELYEKSRDISYQDVVTDNQAFQEKIANLIKSFSTENIHIAIAGNVEKLWNNVSPATQYEVEHIIQELMVNMKKHSQASHVVLRFDQQGQQIYIFYADNGIGMKNGTNFNNGLRNTGNRIFNIGGAINFDANNEKGLKIQITFPKS